jgi:hypothetical protein
MKSIITLALAILLASGSEAAACHRFSVWKYPYPQRCRVVASHDWFVELVKIPTEPGAPDLDQQEHDDAVAAHKEELNWLLSHVHDPDSQFTRQRMQEEEDAR